MIRYFANLFYYFALKIKYKDSIFISTCSKTHLLPKIRVSYGGKITIGNKLKCDRGVLIEACGGIIEIGEDVYINSNVKIVSKKNIVIGDETMIGPNVCIYDHNHDWKNDNVKNKFVSERIRIGKRVWFGANAIVLKGTTISDGCSVAAGTIVSGEFEKDCLILQERKIKTKKKKIDEIR